MTFEIIELKIKKLVLLHKVISIDFKFYCLKILFLLIINEKNFYSLKNTFIFFLKAIHLK